MSADTITFSRDEVRGMLLTVEALGEYLFELVDQMETDKESAATGPVCALHELLEIALGYRTADSDIDGCAMQAIYDEGHPVGQAWLEADRPLILAASLRPLVGTLSDLVGGARDA